jgi:hypothetical protein
VTLNGTGYTPGTYAIGTARLEYTVIAPVFPTGVFATFQLNMEKYHVNGQDVVYPVTLNLRQTGSKNLVLSADPATFQVTAGAWQDTSTVTISIPPGVPSEDGTTLEGSLQMETDPQGSKLGTVTSVQVKIKLVHPSSNCLRTYHFVTDQELESFTAPLEIIVNNGSIRSTNPGQLSDDVFVSNTCPVSETFDLKIELDRAFKTNPNGNPGNAVTTFVTEGTPAPTVNTVALFASGVTTPRHQDLCLAGITMQPNQTLLATVHMALDKNVAPSALPAGGFQFSASFLAPGAAACGGAPLTLAEPNPATATLSYAAK